jgi:hypothetical protein
MLIVAISHGYTSPGASSKAFKVSSSAMAVPTLRNCFRLLERKYDIDTSQLDELIVIENDHVLYHYNQNAINDEFEEVDEEELEFVEKVA